MKLETGMAKKATAPATYSTIHTHTHTHTHTRQTSVN